jgi:hypothetical protein
LLVLLAVIQLFRPEKNEGTPDGPAHLTSSFTVPPDVQAILKASCYDCHSNRTEYPWYAEVMPVGWWLDGHVQEGKQHLNFSEFTSGSLRRQYHKFEEIAEMVEAEAMPLPSYLLVHRQSELSAEQRRSLTGWSMAMREGMRASYPPDSLERRR